MSEAPPLPESWTVTLTRPTSRLGRGAVCSRHWGLTWHDEAWRGRRSPPRSAGWWTLWQPALRAGGVGVLWRHCLAWSVRLFWRDFRMMQTWQPNCSRPRDLWLGLGARFPAAIDYQA